MGSILRATERPDQILWCHIVASLVTWTLGLWLVHRGGSPPPVIREEALRPVIPAYAGIQCVAGEWIPAFAGMTASGTGD